MAVGSIDGEEGRVDVDVDVDDHTRDDVVEVEVEEGGTHVDMVVDVVDEAKAETIEGCVVVDLHDSSRDVASLLHALYDGPSVFFFHYHRIKKR